MRVGSRLWSRYLVVMHNNSFSRSTVHTVVNPLGHPMQMRTRGPFSNSQAKLAAQIGP